PSSAEVGNEGGPDSASSCTRMAPATRRVGPSPPPQACKPTASAVAAVGTRRAQRLRLGRFRGRISSSKPSNSGSSGASRSTQFTGDPDASGLSTTLQVRCMGPPCRGGAGGACRRRAAARSLEARRAEGVSFSHPCLVLGRPGARAAWRSKGTRVLRDASDRARFHRWIGDDLELRVHASPGAKHTEARGIHGDALKVRLRAKAVAGAANAALIEFLATKSQVPRKRCVLVNGDTSREKLVRVEQPPRDRAERLLRDWAQGRTSS